MYVWKKDVHFCKVLVKWSLIQLSVYYSRSPLDLKCFYYEIHFGYSIIPARIQVQINLLYCSAAHLRYENVEPYFLVFFFQLKRKNRPKNPFIKGPIYRCTLNLLMNGAGILRNLLSNLANEFSGTFVPWRLEITRKWYSIRIFDHSHIVRTIRS